MNTPDEQIILDHIRKHGHITETEAWGILPESVKATTGYILKRMRNDGLIALDLSQFRSRDSCYTEPQAERQRQTHDPEPATLL
jgi:hypothetical protein